jgi:Zn-dependent alcohol dehydrogenase
MLASNATQMSASPLKYFLGSSKMPLEDINEAFEKALRGEEGKILIKP